MEPTIVIAACDGSYRVLSDVWSKPLVTSDPDKVATWLLENQVDTWFYSSSMEQATRHGFAEDDQRSVITNAYVNASASA